MEESLPSIQEAVLRKLRGANVPSLVPTLAKSIEQKSDRTNRLPLASKSRIYSAGEVPIDGK